MAHHDFSGEPGLVDRVLALHAGSRGFNSHRGHMSERFFRSNRPGYPHPVSSELEISGIRVTVGDCSVTERRRWRPPYQTGKTVHVHTKTLQTQQGRTHGARCVRQWFRTAEPLGERRYENWNTHTHTHHDLCLDHEICSMHQTGVMQHVLGCLPGDTLCMKCVLQ